MLEHDTSDEYLLEEHLDLAAYADVPHDLPADPESANSPGGGEERLPDFTDQSVANVFLSQHRHEVLHVTEWDTWLAWDGTRWVRNPKKVDRLMTATVASVERRFVAGLAKAKQRAAQGDDSADVKGYEAVLRAIRTYKNDGRLKAALNRAKVSELVEAAASDLDSDPYLLNCANGTVDLRTGKLKPHDPSDRITRVLDLDYNPKAKAPVWERSLFRWLSGDPELSRFVQKAVGYTLTGSTKETCLFFTYGVGANGKSTYLTALQEILGEYAMTGADSLLNSKDGVRSDDVAALAGKRYVVAPEITDRRSFDEADVKRLTSSDKLSARELYGKPFTFTPTHKLWLTGNHLPTVKDFSGGFWRRMRVVPFLVTIPDVEKDRDLDEKLRREYEGILAWAVRGAVEWYRSGLEVPAIVVEATASYRKEVDLVGAFLEEHVVEDPKGWVSTGDLYARYVSWCDGQGLKHPLTQIALGRELKSRGFEARKVSGNRWVGVRLKTALELVA